MQNFQILATISLYHFLLLSSGYVTVVSHLLFELFMIGKEISYFNFLLAPPFFNGFSFGENRDKDLWRFVSDTAAKLPYVAFVGSDSTNC